MENKNLRICVYTISKNEEAFVKRWADSAKDADLLLIADTGSTDKTLEIAKECGVQVHSIFITPWRFDHARNASIALIPKDIDICICMDVDEVLEPGWREEIERVWIPNQTTRLSYMFDWGAGIRFRYEKIHARNGYYWHHPCHEYPVYDKRITEVYAYTEKLLVSHYPDPTKSRGQYLDLLELSVKEDPACPRNAFYYARELSFGRRWQESINECNRYLSLPGATWENERCYAYRVMGICYEEMGNRPAAEGAFQKAAAEAPNTREPWCQLAMLYYRDGRWAECFGASMRALSIKDKALVYTADPAVWGHWPHDLASVSAWNLGLKDVALEQAQLAVDASPNEQRLVNNLNLIRDSLVPKKKIPNIIHFMWFVGPKSREFTYLNYLAVKVASEVQKPDKIYFYYNQDLPDNPNWQAVKQYVEMVHMEPPTELDGVSLDNWPQYQADVVRLQKLYEHGGIYLDTDSFMLKPFDDLLDNPCVLSGYVEGFSEGAKKGDNEYVSGAVILAEPKSEFIKLWLGRLAEGIKSGVWAWHCVVLPIEIYRERPELIHLIQAEQFLPFDFKEKRIIEEEHTDDVLSLVSKSYTIHMWDTIWTEDLKKIDYDYLRNVDNAFTRLFRSYA